jgi:hypothetical protein
VKIAISSQLPAFSQDRELTKAMKCRVGTAHHTFFQEQPRAAVPHLVPMGMSFDMNNLAV